MKRTILVVLLVVMIATPCFAQEGETEGLFSIEGTLWNLCRIGIKSREPYFPPLECYPIGFYQGSVYKCSENGCLFMYHGSYIDTPVLSIAFNDNGHGLYVMQPTAEIGLHTYLGCLASYGSSDICYFRIGILFKEDNNWSPYDQPIFCGGGNCPEEEMHCVESDDCDPILDSRCNPVCVRK